MSQFDGLKQFVTPPSTWMRSEGIDRLALLFLLGSAGVASGFVVSGRGPTAGTLRAPAPALVRSRPASTALAMRVPLPSLQQVSERAGSRRGIIPDIAHCAEALAPRGS